LYNPLILLVVFLYNLILNSNYNFCLENDVIETNFKTETETQFKQKIK